MPWTPSGWQWAPFLLAVWLLYELLRYAVVSSAKRRYEQQVDHFLKQHDIPVDSFRHTHRVVVKERVMGDAGLVLAMDQRARAEGKTLHEVRLRVRGWLDEIVPQFNILAYYKVGYALARTVAYSLYNVRLDKQSLEAARAKIPKDAAVVYVSNHRSNADFVVTGFMLSRSVQVSYAVGEWARVWPLESLFKAFGSYFVRRGEKDPLYHRTLEAYLQLITKQGVTQAMFPEGGLTRDGRLREPKVGLLDNMAKAKLDPDFTRPLVFVPVGINFDRVVEDENMVYEARTGRHRYQDRTFWQKIGRIFSLVRWLLYGVPVNIVRFLARRLKKHGVVAIRFGEPVVFDDWYKGQTFLAEPERHVRWQALRPFADDLLARIAKIIPVTSVTLTCLAARDIGPERMQVGVDRGTMLLAMRACQDRLRAAGAAFATGDPYEDRPRHGHVHEVDHVTAGMDAAAELEAVLQRALDVTSRRKMLYERGGVVVAPKWDLVEYYARSLDGDGASAAAPEPAGDTSFRSPDSGVLLA